MSDTRKVRPRVKSAAGRSLHVQTAPVEKGDGLSEGDTYEFSTTAEVKNAQGRSWWVKAGATSSVRPGENGYDTEERVKEFVLRSVHEQIKEILS